MTEQSNKLAKRAEELRRIIDKEEDRIRQIIGLKLGVRTNDLPKTQLHDSDEDFDEFYDRTG